MVSLCKIKQSQQNILKMHQSKRLINHEIVEKKNPQSILVQYSPLSKYLSKRAKWAKKRIVQKCECNIFLSKVLRSQVGTKELFSTILFSTEISLKVNMDEYALRLLIFDSWLDIIFYGFPLFFFRLRGVGNILILEF